MRPSLIPLTSAVIFLMFGLSGCGGDSRSSSFVTARAAAIMVIVSPASIGLGASETQQFNASVTSSSNTGVIWNLTCTAADCGTISSSGLYTAPSLIPNSVAVTVTATSQAEPARSASATVWNYSLAVAVSPFWPTSMAPGATRTFNASIAYHSNHDVTWTVSGIGCAGDACGLLTDVSAHQATYTAPSTFATAATAVVTATSVADKTKSQAVKINLMPMSQPLNGRYAFLFRAADSSTVLAASLVADANGHLSGIGDLVSASGAQVNQPFTGTYTLGADRRGTIQIRGAGATLTLRMVVVTGNFGRLLDFSGTGDGHGWFEKQNETAFSPAIISGGAYMLAGTSDNTFTSRVGSMSWDAQCGGSAIAFYWYSFFAGCSIDTTTGRGTVVPNNPQDAMFSTAPHMVFYTVDATHALMIGDIAKPSLRLSGSMNTWTGSFESLAGDYSYYMATPTSLSAGRFTVTSSADPYKFVITGIQDEVRDGGVSLDVPVTGQIGLGGFDEPILTLTIGGVSLGEVVYETSTGGFLFVGENGTYGEAYLQQGGPFSAGALSGDFSLQLFGRDAHALAMATLSPPALTGTADVSNAGLTAAAGMNGTISLDGGDRANLTLSTGATGTLPFRAYMISPKKMLLISTTPGQVTMGWAEKAE